MVFIWHIHLHGSSSCMPVSEFNTIYLDTLLEKLPFENKNIILMGDFNINILYYYCSPDTSTVLNNMCLSAIFPYNTTS